MISSDETSSKDGPRCWAGQFGQCAGKLTGEHPVSRALLLESVTICGFRWCMNKPKTIGRDSFVANILCERHNHMLSLVDAEAKKLKNFIQEVMFPPGKKPGLKKAKGTPAPAKFVTIKAHLFGRWLAKTYCNLEASSGLQCDGDFARHALGKTSSRGLNFYSPAHVDQVIRHKLEYIRTLDASNDRGDIIFYVDFYGLQWVTTNFELDASGYLVLERVGLALPAQDLMNRCRELIMVAKKPRFRAPPLWKLRLEWDDHTG